MGFVGMAEEDMSFPRLVNSTISDTNRRTELVSVAIVCTQLVNITARLKTHLQKPRVFALLHALLDKLQRLLEILRINGILDLVVAPLKNSVVGGRHHGEVESDWELYMCDLYPFRFGSSAGTMEG